MKHLSFKLLGTLALGGLLFLGACNGDDDDNGEPQVTKPSMDFIGSGDYTSSDETVDKGDTVRFKWVIQKGDNDLDRFSITGGQAGGTVYDSTNLSDNNADRYEDQIGIRMNDAGEHQYTFEAWDTENNKTSKSITITVEEQEQVQTYDQTLLAAPLLEEDSESFYASSDNSTYTKNEADGDANIQGKIDFGYWYSQDDGAVLVNTEEYPAYELEWSNTSTTQFGETDLEVSTFVGIGNSDEVIVNATSDLSSKNATNLQEDDIVAFETDGGKKGLIKVNNVTEGAGTEGKIEFRVKIQK